MSNHEEEELQEEQDGGGIFDILDADEEEEKEEIVTDKSSGMNAPSINTPKVYRVPVNLYKDDTTGEQYFYLQKGTFPNRSITNLKVLYTPKERSQVREQVLANKTCPEILLKNVKVECSLSSGEQQQQEEEANLEDDDDYLNDESFRLSGSKIASIRMRMYAKQKMQAQKQLEDPNCAHITLYLDIECRLASREQPPAQ